MKPEDKKNANDDVDIEIEDDEEYGGEGVGRVVWEWYETRLKAWEAEAQTEENNTGAEKSS